MKNLKQAPAFWTLFAVIACPMLWGEPNALRGSEPLLLGLSPHALALGGAIVTEDGEHGLTALNPAVPATLLRHNLSLSYLGLSGSYNGFSMSFSVPTLYGVFSLNYTGILSGGSSLGDLHGGSLGFAKEVSTRLRFGGQIGVDISSSSPLTNATATPGVYVDLAMIYNDPNPSRTPVGIGHFRWGLLFKQLGLFPNVTTNNVVATIRPGFDLRIGTSFDWLSTISAQTPGRGFTSRILVDASLVPAPFNMTVNAGLKNTIALHAGPLAHLGLDVGGFFAFDRIGIQRLGPWSAGLRLGFDFKPGELEFAYALVPETVTSGGGFFHSLTLSMAFGRRDNKAPVIDTGTF